MLVKTLEPRTESITAAPELEPEEITEIVKIFKALADSSRLQIINTLAEDRRLCVSDIAEQLEMSVSNVSHHLGKLDDLDFVSYKKQGKEVYYRLDDECIRDILWRARDHVCGL